MPRGRKKKTDGVDPQGWKGASEQTEARVNTHDGNGSTSMVVAPEPAPPEPIVVPQGEEAVRVLEELALQNRRVQTARTRLDDAIATMKARKGTWEKESTRLSTMLAEATSGQNQPTLFDAAQSEADLQRMEAAIDAAQQAPEGSGEAVPEPASESGGEAPTLESVQEITPPAGSEAPALVSEESMPF